MAVVAVARATVMIAAHTVIACCLASVITLRAFAVSAISARMPTAMTATVSTATATATAFGIGRGHR